MPTTLQFPQDLLRLLYWLYFKPFTLHYYAQTISRELDWNLQLWKLSPELRNDPRVVNLVRLSLTLQCCLPIFGVIILGVLLEKFASLSFYWQSSILVTLGWQIGILIGFVIRWKGLKRFERWAWIVYVVALVVALTYTILHTYRPDLWQALLLATVQFFGGPQVYSIIQPLAQGFAFGVAVGVAGGVAFGVAGGVAVGVAVGVAGGVAFGVAGGVAVGVAFGVAWTLSFLAFYFRLPFYLIELPWQLVVGFFAESAPPGKAAKIFQFSPIYYDELIWLPLFGLDGDLIEIGKKDRQAAQQLIIDVANSFRQGWAATNALIELTAYDVERAQDTRAIANIVEQFAWLPPTMPKDLENVLPSIRDIAAYVQAALESDTLWNKQEQLRKALAQTQRVREGFALSRNRQIAARFGRALETWEDVLNKELSALGAREIIPNVYVPGSLATASKVFKGRRDLFLALERELATPAETRPTLLLFGARRCGKTSALKQLPVRLGPEVIPVEVDFHDATLGDDVNGLLFVLADRIKHNAITHRRIQLPTLTRDDLRADPYLVFREWLARVEEATGDRWLLLGLDEFERLEEMREAGRIDTRIFGFLRHLIQHHPRITVLLSGSHTLQDLPPIWSDHFINVRVLKIGNLKEDEARELIEKPIEDFPLEYEPAAVERIIEVTGCQPYLVQTTCRDLVNALNEQNRTRATLADVERALDSVLTSCAGYFQDLWSNARDSDDAQRAVMRTIATNKDLRGLEDLEGLDAALRKLVHRDILVETDGGYKFRVELVRRWVERNT